MRDRNGDAIGPAMKAVSSFGCSASGEELVAVGQALRAAIGDQLVEGERTADGVVLRIARHPGAEAALKDYARRERACCSFLDVAVSEDGDVLSLTIRGPSDAAQLLDLLYRVSSPGS